MPNIVVSFIAETLIKIADKYIIYAVITNYVVP